MATSKQKKQLRDALVKSFSRDELDDLLLTEFDKRLEVLFGDVALERAGLDLVEYFDRRNELPKFVQVVRQARPNVPDLTAICDEISPATEWTGPELDIGGGSDDPRNYPRINVVIIGLFAA